MQTNVIEHATAKWADLKRLNEEEQKHHANARALWPQIARRMAELRAMYSSDNDFGAELVKREIECGKDDRAAYIWMGQLKPSALEDAMAQCDRRSARTFCAEVKSWGDPYFAPVSQSAKPTGDYAVTTESAETSPMEPQAATEQVAESHAEEQPHPAATRVSPRSIFAELPPEVAAALLAAVGGNHKHPAVRVISVLIHGKGKGGKKAAHAFLTWWAARLAEHSARAPLAQNELVLDATHIVPNLGKSFKQQWQIVANGAFNKTQADNLMRDFDALRAAAAENLTLVEYQRRTQATHAARRAQEATATATAVAPAGCTLTDGTVLHPKPIIVAGDQLFPHDNRGELSYQDALVYAHIVRQYIVTPREMAGQDLETIGREVGTMGTHWLTRQHPLIGRYLSAMGQKIRNYKGDPAHLFVMEPIPPQTTER